MVVACFLLRVLVEGDSSNVGEGNVVDLFHFALVFLIVFLLENPLGVACSSGCGVSATGSLITTPLEVLFFALATDFFFLELDAAAVTLLPLLEASFFWSRNVVWIFFEPSGWVVLAISHPFGQVTMPHYIA